MLLCLTWDKTKFKKKFLIFHTRFKKILGLNLMHIFYDLLVSTKLFKLIINFIIAVCVLDKIVSQIIAGDIFPSFKNVLFFL